MELISHDVRIASYDREPHFKDSDSTTEMERYKAALINSSDSGWRLLAVHYSQTKWVTITYSHIDTMNTKVLERNIIY